MPGRFAGAARIGTDGRIDDEYAQIRIFQVPVFEIAPPEKENADAVRLADRAQRPFPNPDPPGMRDKPKLRAFGPQFLAAPRRSATTSRLVTPGTAPWRRARRRRHGGGAERRDASVAEDVKAFAGLCCRGRAGPCTCALRRAQAVRRKVPQGCAAFRRAVPRPSGGRAGPRRLSSSSMNTRCSARSAGQRSVSSSSRHVGLNSRTVRYARSAA